MFGGEEPTEEVAFAGFGYDGELGVVEAQKSVGTDLGAGEGVAADEAELVGGGGEVVCEVFFYAAADVGAVVYGVFNAGSGKGNSAGGVEVLAGK